MVWLAAQSTHFGGFCSLANWFNRGLPPFFNFRTWPWIWSVFIELHMESINWWWCS